MGVIKVLLGLRVFPGGAPASPRTPGGLMYLSDGTARHHTFSMSVEGHHFEPLRPADLCTLVFVRPGVIQIRCWCSVSVCRFLYDCMPKLSLCRSTSRPGFGVIFKSYGVLLASRPCAFDTRAFSWLTPLRLLAGAGLPIWIVLGNSGTDCLHVAGGPKIKAGRVSRASLHRPLVLLSSPALLL
jgi:hypothetical protein